MEKKLNCILGCEESQAVTIELDALGHYVTSVDIQDCSGPRPDLHIKDSIFHVLCRPTYSVGLNLGIFHPPCTFLANSGVRWLTSRKPKPGYEWSAEHKIYINPERWEQMVDGALFFRALLHTNADGVAIENPVMHKYALAIIGMKPTQVIQPWQFGHQKMKATCFWLKGLPILIPTDIVGPPPKDKKERYKWQDVWTASPGPDRQKIRSKTYPGIAKAMAKQWSEYLINKNKPNAHRQDLFTGELHV